MDNGEAKEKIFLMLNPSQTKIVETCKTEEES